MKKISWIKILVAIIYCLSAGFFSYWLQPLVHGNHEILNLLITTFSILAGFLIAIISIVGDPSLVPAGSWRLAEINYTLILKKLYRYKMLFLLYLITLILIFAALIVEKQVSEMSIWIERGFLFCSILAFFCSISLPEALVQMQKAKMEALIENMKKPA